MMQIAQVVGAILVLIPFAWSQLGRLGTASMLYLALNFLGSGLLAVLALHERQWGFLLLEGIWAMVAAWGLGRPSLEPDARRSSGACSTHPCQR